MKTPIHSLFSHLQFPPALGRDISNLLAAIPRYPVDGPTEVSVADWAPLFGMRETKEAFLVSVDLPGVKKEAIEIHVHGGCLEISGQRPEVQLAEGEKSYDERAWGSFVRRMKLPSLVVAENISANYKDGVLEVTVPKAEAAKPKKIEISVS